jgi:hypothetical protein
MEDKSYRRYLAWMVGFTLLAAAFTLYIVLNNGDANDMLFVAEVLGIGFCVNIVASIVLMVFFSQRDKQIRATHERSAARRVALEIVRYLRTDPQKGASRNDSRANNLHPDINILRDKLEYLLDTLHFALNDEVKRDIEHFLHTTEDDAKGADPDKTALNEIETIAAALKRRYGEEIFATARSRRAKQNS